MAPSPSIPHQSINALIISQLTVNLAGCGLCRALMPVDYKIAEDTILQPDALVICEPYDKGNFITKAPEIVFEILSPATRQKDTNLKYDLYERAGVKYYIIVDPLKKTCSVYKLVNANYELTLKTVFDKFHFDLGPCSFDFDFAKIWD